MTVRDHGKHAVLVSDALPCSWSEQSRQSAWLLGLIQAPVGSGMTPLQQPTDSHMAKPAKDTARTYHHTVRMACRVDAARREAPIKYDTGPRQLVEVAHKMHTAMVHLNASSDIVLKACRATGWLAYRPTAHSPTLVQTVEDQQWAKTFPMGAGRITQHQLKNRFSWLDPETGKPQLRLLSLLKEQKMLAVPQQTVEAPKLPKIQHQVGPQKDDLVIDVDMHLDPDGVQAVMKQLLQPCDRDDSDVEDAIESISASRTLTRKKAPKGSSKTSS